MLEMLKLEDIKTFSKLALKPRLCWESNKYWVDLHRNTIFKQLMIIIFILLILWIDCLSANEVRANSIFSSFS